MIKIFQKWGILILFLLLTTCSQEPDAHDSNGHPIRLSDYRGKWVMINYWALWCKPCLTEIPALNTLYRHHSDKVMVLGVSYDHLPNRKIRAIAKKLKVTYPLLASFPLEKLGTNNISVLPITFVLNPKGLVAEVLKGPQNESDLMRAIGFNKKHRK